MQQKRIKYLGVNLPKEAKELYSKSWTRLSDFHFQKTKLLMKEIKDGTSRWRAIACSWIGRTGLWNWLSYTQSILQSQRNPCQIIKDIFHRIRTKNLTICIETRKTSNSQSSPFFFFKIYFIFWLWWVLVATLSLCLVAAGRDYLRQCLGFSLCWLCVLWSTGPSRHTSFSSWSTQAQ